MDAKDVDTVVEEEPYQELIPPDSKAPAVGEKIWQIFEEVVEDKQNQGLHDRWIRNYELGRNKHWRYESKKVSLISANLLYIHRQRTVNHLTDNHPTFNVRAVGKIEDEDRQKIDALKYAATHWWQETEQQGSLADSIWNGETYGSTIEWVRFNPELEMGIGEVETILVDPFYFGTYPVNERDNQKALVNMVYMPMHLQDAKKRWPDHADKIRTDSDILAELGDERKEMAAGTSKGKAQTITLGGVVKRLLGYSKEAASGYENQCLIIICYVKDYTMVKAKFSDMPDQQFQTPKYTGGIRQIITCNQGELVLEDKDNPNVNPDLDPEQQMLTYLYDKFPFTRVNSLQETTQAWGPSDFEQLEALNMELDKSLSQFNTAKDRVARAKVINPKTSGVPNEHITNYLGIINPTNVNHGIAYLESQAVNQDLLLAINMYKEFFFLVAGSFELEQAQTPGKDVIAYKAIAALLERAATMMRGKIRSYSKMIRERGRMYLSHLMNFYTEDRWISYEEAGETQQMPVNGSQLILPSRLTVVSGSTMPVSEVQQREEALILSKLGQIDQQALLEALDYPDRRAIIKRMRMGPIGMYLTKLQHVLPPQIMQLLTQIAKMDDKDFAKAMEKGEIQPIQIPGEQLNPGQVKAFMEMKVMEAELQEKMAQAAKTKADAEKVAADRALVAEQIVTERVRQRVAMAGIKLDEEKLKLERAKVVDELEKGEKEMNLNVVDRAHKSMEMGLKYHKDKAQGGSYNERGLKSNNLDVLE